MYENKLDLYDSFPDKDHVKFCQLVRAQRMSFCLYSIIEAYKEGFCILHVDEKTVIAPSDEENLLRKICTLYW